jgi:hypothetical protein
MFEFVTNSSLKTHLLLINNYYQYRFIVSYAAADHISLGLKADNRIDSYTRNMMVQATT